eukprot:6918237-Pyramimonas_sp.AAC.1
MANVRRTMQTKRSSVTLTGGRRWMRRVPPGLIQRRFGCHPCDICVKRCFHWDGQFCRRIGFPRDPPPRLLTCRHVGPVGRVPVGLVRFVGPVRHARPGRFAGSVGLAGPVGPLQP